MTRAKTVLRARREVLFYLNDHGGAERETIVDHVTDEVDGLSEKGAQAAVDQLETNGEIYSAGESTVYRRVSIASDDG